MKCNIIIIFICAYTFAVAQSKEQKVFYFSGSGSYSIVEVVDIPNQNYYYYDVLPIVGSEVNIGLKYFLFKEKLFSNISIAYLRNGFEGRIFEEVVLLDLNEYRMERWETIRNNNLKITLGVGMLFYEKYFFIINSSYVFPIVTNVHTREVFLSDVFGADIFKDAVQSMTDRFMQNSFEIEIVVGAKLTEKLSFFIGGGYGIGSISNVDEQGFWLENRTLKLGLVLDIL